MPRPILVAKFGPARTSFGKIGPFLATKWSRGTIFGHQNRSGGPLLGEAPFPCLSPSLLLLATLGLQVTIARKKTRDEARGR